MTKRLEVQRALAVMIARATGPFAQVVTVEDDDGSAKVIPAAPGALAGLIVVRAGDPGEPEYTLSPLTYTYAHGFPVEIAAYPMNDGPTSAEAQLDQMLEAIAAAIMADRTLGGLAEWMDATAPETEILFVVGAAPARSAIPTITVTYSTNSPL